MSPLKTHSGIVVILAIIQWLGGLYLFYLIRVINDISTASQIIPLHTIIAIIFFIALVALLLRSAKLGMGKITSIPLILLIIQGLLGFVILLAINQTLQIDLATLTIISLYIHHPLGWLVMLTTLYAGLKLIRGGAAGGGSSSA